MSNLNLDLILNMVLNNYKEFINKTVDSKDKSTSNKLIITERYLDCFLARFPNVLFEYFSLDSYNKYIEKLLCE